MTLKEELDGYIGLTDIEIALIISIKSDIRYSLEKFYEDYWKESYEGDKYKRCITCDELDYLMDKHFGKLVNIKTLQILESEK